MLNLIVAKAKPRSGILIVAMAILALLPTTNLLAESGPSPSTADRCRQAADRGREFLAGLMDPELGLLPEFPGANRYWLWHDNFIAARVLAGTHPELSRKILQSMKREGDSATDGKMEITLGDVKSVLPLRSYDLREVRKVGERRILNERPTDRLMTGSAKYADLLLYTAMSVTEPVDARQHWNAAIGFWDGKGLADAPYAHERQTYTTFKLALALIASHQLTQRHGQAFELPDDAVRERLLSLQNDAGGWFTNYERDGTPRGKANVETTSLAILGLEASLM